MMLRTRTACAFFLTLALLATAGCGGGGRDKPDTVNVSGTIYLDNKPLADALVTFSTEEFAGTGRTNSEGKYTLAQGAVPGDNKVTVEKWEGGGVELNPEEGMDEGQFEAMADPDMTGKKKVDVGPKQLIPLHYSDPKKSDLSFPVPDGGTDSADFRLQSK